MNVVELMIEFSKSAREEKVLTERVHRDLTRLAAIYQEKHQEKLNTLEVETLTDEEYEAHYGEVREIEGRLRRIITALEDYGL